MRVGCNTSTATTKGPLVKGFKCPYCREIRPSRSVLQRHVDKVHPHAEGMADRMRAVDLAQTVDVPATVRVDIEPAPAQDTTSERLAAARGEIRSLKETAEKVLARLEALDVQATDPSAIRRQTLLDVMSRMIETDNPAAYLTVLTMLKDEA